MATGAVRNKYTFHNLRSGVKYRVRVRAVNRLGYIGPYSDPVDIIAGVGSTSQPSDTVSGLTVNPYLQGVDVTWNSHAGAQGYEVYVTESSGTPPDPDPTNKAQLYYRGNGTHVLVKTRTAYNVKVKVLWYDAFGRYSTGVALETGKAES